MGSSLRPHWGMNISRVPLVRIKRDILFHARLLSLQGSFTARVRRRRESRFHIFMLNEVKHLCLRIVELPRPDPLLPPSS